MDGLGVIEVPLRQPALERPAEEAARPSPGATVFRHLLWAAAWGCVQLWLVAQVLHSVSWEKLPYNTIENVAVWCFLAANLTGCVLLGYAFYRFRQRVLWLWWAACATWWVVLLIPYRATHAAFAARVQQSEQVGEGLAKRVEAYRRARGRLPGRLEDVARRDGKPLPSTAFGTAFEYRPLDLKNFELVAAPAEGDRTYCFSTREPKAGFRLSYFRQ